VSDYYADIDAMVADRPLFKAAALARTTDPDTSHQAVRRVPRAGQCRAVLEALRAGPAGQTEIGRRTGMLPHQVNKRLNDLKLARLAEPTGRKVEGGSEREWRATDGR